MHDIPKPLSELTGSEAPYIPPASPFTESGPQGEITVPGTEVYEQAITPEVPTPNIPAPQPTDIGQTAVRGTMARNAGGSTEGVSGPTPERPKSSDMPAEPSEPTAEQQEVTTPIETDSEKSHLYIPPRFRYSGPLAQSAAARQAWKDFVDIGRHDTHFAHEAPPNEDDHNMAFAITEATARVGERLGLHLTKIPNENEYHFFETADDYRTAAVSIFGEEIDVGVGTNHPTIGPMILKVADDHIATASTTAHEVGHAVADMTIRLDSIEVDGSVIPTFTEIQEGYVRIGDTRNTGVGANEVGVDMLMREIVYEAGYPEVVYSYAPLDVITSGIIKRTAKAENKPAAEIALSFIKGRLIGDHSTLDMMARTLGQERMDQYMALRGNETPEEMTALAREWGLTDAEQLIADMLAGRPVDPFNWD